MADKVKLIKRTYKPLPINKPGSKVTDPESTYGLPNRRKSRDIIQEKKEKPKTVASVTEEAKDLHSEKNITKVIIKADRDKTIGPINSTDKNNNQKASESIEVKPEIPEVLRKQGTASHCSSNIENNCPCSTFEAVEQVSRQISYCDRKNYISVDRLNELRKKAQDAIKNHKTFTIRGCFFSIRNALTGRGWVEKLDIHRKHVPSGICQVTFDDLTQTLPKRRPGETRRQYLIKCERNIMSRFLEHMPIDFLWTARKEKCDWIDQAKNPSMIINKFHRVPFTTKEGLCSQLRDFHWFYEEGMSELYFPRCYNVWSPEELTDFLENFRVTACIGFLKWLVDKFSEKGYEAVFSEYAKVPLAAIDFAFKRCNEFLESSQHYDIDVDEHIRIWDHDWDAFLTHHFLLTHENARIQADPKRQLDGMVNCARRLLEQVQLHWPQYSLDGCLNIWIVKPANKCRGRGIQLMNNIKKIMQMVNPPIATKSRYVVQKYLERPLIIHNTKFDIRQWFLVTSVQPLIIWMYKESYLRFSSQEYNLTNYHESVHLTNHAIQKKYRNGKRDERLPSENMWDCYTFQAYLRQSEYEMWGNRIYPGMQRAIIGTMLASQDNMDRRSNTFELFGADFMISEDFYPWLIEINSSPDLGATTSVTARMCPQCLEDVIKVIIDRKVDPKADTGNFEMIYRQLVPPTPAYMGLNLFLKGKQINTRNTILRKERSATTFSHFKLTTTSYRRQRTFSSGSPPFTAPTYQSNFFPDKDISTENSAPILMNLFDTFNTADQTGLSRDNEGAIFKGPLNTITSNKSNNEITTNLLRSETSPNLNNTKLLFPLYKRPGTQHSQTLPQSPNRKAKLYDRPWRITTDLNANQKTSQSGPRRHLSCGPKILPAEDVPQNVEVSDVTISNVEGQFQCVGNKCNIDTPKEPESSIAPSTPKLNSTAASRKQIYELLYKSKSARTQKPERLFSKPKSSSTPLPATASGIRSSVTTLKKIQNIENSTPSKDNKPTMVNDPNNEYMTSSFYAVGMSLRAWRSRYNRIWKGTNSVQSALVPFKNVSANSPVRPSPKRQLCKNLTKKINDCKDHGRPGN